MRAELDSKQRLKRRKKAAALKALLFLFIILGISAGLYSIPRYQEINISKVEISGNETVSSSEIEEAVKKELQGNKYFFFPKKNIFWYPEEKIREALLSLDPHISSASVSFSNFQTISVSVTERFPQALWCGGTFQSIESDVALESCYFLDKTGFVYTKAPGFFGSPFIRFYGSLSTSTRPIIGQQFITEADFKSLTFLIDKMKKEGFAANAVAIYESNLVEVYLLDGGKLLFTTDQDFEKEFENFKTLVESADFKERSADGTLHFNYIDLRFGNKLFYKL